MIEILSSYRPASGGRPAGQYGIQYRLGDRSGTGPRTEVGSGVVGLAAPRPARWTDCSLTRAKTMRGCGPTPSPTMPRSGESTSV